MLRRYYLQLPKFKAVQKNFLILKFQISMAHILTPIFFFINDRNSYCSQYQNIFFRTFLHALSTNFLCSLFNLANPFVLKNSEGWKMSGILFFNWFLCQADWKKIFLLVKPRLFRNLNFSDIKNFPSIFFYISNRIVENFLFFFFFKIKALVTWFFYKNHTIFKVFLFPDFKIWFH